MSEIDCRYFNGYRPCKKNLKTSNLENLPSIPNSSLNCDFRCPHREIIKETILIVHLGALGSVVRSSAILRKIKNQSPQAYVIWLTGQNALPILENHPAIDKLLGLSFESYLILKNFIFDKVYVIDKCLEATGIISTLKAKKIFGFQANDINGAILPVNDFALENWKIGLSDEVKFYINKKTELQLIFESLGFDYENEKYWVFQTSDECEQSLSRKQEWLNRFDKKIILGISTGCGAVIPYKKLSVEKHIELIKLIDQQFPNIQMVLLGGGKEDHERNEKIAEGCIDVSLIQSSTQSGMRDGMISVKACDLVISGDSLGMHLSIALEVFTIAWFGPTCEHEIDVFSHGIKIKSQIQCSPCWKRSCNQPMMCYDLIESTEFIRAINYGLSKIVDNNENDAKNSKANSKANSNANRKAGNKANNKVNDESSKCDQFVADRDL